MKKKKWQQQDWWWCWFKKQESKMMGLEEPLKDTRKNMGITFTSGDESNMKARGFKRNFTQFNVC